MVTGYGCLVHQRRCLLVRNGVLPQPTYYSVFSLSRASARMGEAAGEAAGNPAPAMRLQDIRVDFKCQYVLYAQRLIHNPIQERALGQVSRTPSEEANA